jgi:hypothetical protein
VLLAPDVAVASHENGGTLGSASFNSAPPPPYLGEIRPASSCCAVLFQTVSSSSPGASRGLGTLNILEADMLVTVMRSELEQSTLLLSYRCTNLSVSPGFADALQAGKC